ncbi:Hypothetical protein A7982_13489 [Minicystis rosea]|nr:Hypothetical protein A7982_13489 [Minicystis rosea]
MSDSIEIASAIWVTEPVTDLRAHLNERLRGWNLRLDSWLVFEGEYPLNIHFEIVAPDTFADRPWHRAQHDCPFVGALAGYVCWEYDLQSTLMEEIERFAFALLREGRGVTARLADDRSFEAVRLCTFHFPSVLSKFGVDDGDAMLTHDEGPYSEHVLGAVRSAIAGAGFQCAYVGWTSTCHNPLRLAVVQPKGSDTLYPALWGPDGELCDPDEALRGVSVEFWAYDLWIVRNPDFWQAPKEQLDGDELLWRVLEMAPVPLTALLDVLPSRIDSLIASLDLLIGAQVDEILHHPDFQRLERAWRGLWFVIERTRFEENIQIELFDCSWQDLRDDFEDAASLAESGLFKTVYTRAVGSGRDPYGAIIANYELGPAAQDVYLMRKCAAAAFSAQAPFIAAAAPSFFGVESYTQLANLTFLPGAFERPLSVQWHGFRETRDARAFGLTLPRFLLRAPYHRGGRHPSSFEYEEMVFEHEELCWGNASFAFATRLTESFARYRWCPNIIGPVGGGMIEGLPEPPDGLAGPTEVRVSAGTERILSESGFLPLVGMSEGRACFYSASSLQKPMGFSATAGGRADETSFPLETQLPYFFIVSRLVHYLEIIYRTYEYAHASRAAAERELDAWVHPFVTESGGVEAGKRGHRLLRAVRITVTETEDDERRTLELTVCPHFKHMGHVFFLSVTHALEPGPKPPPPDTL